MVGEWPVTRRKEAKMRLLWKTAASMAMQMEKRLPDSEIREMGDERTERDLDSYELDKLVRLVKEHPAYQALPEIPEGEL